MYEYRNNPYPDSRLHADCCGHRILSVQAELRQYFMAALVDAAWLQIPWASLWVRLSGTQHQSAFFPFPLWQSGYWRCFSSWLRICPTTYRQKDGFPSLQFFTLPMPPVRCFFGGRIMVTASAMAAGLRHSAMERYIRFFWQLQPHLPFTWQMWWHYLFIVGRVWYSVCSVVCSSYMTISGYSGFVATMNTVTR